MVTRETARLFEYHAWTFVIPNTAFGIFGALASHVLTTNKPTNFSVILIRIPCVLAWNWLNLFVFDLANQRSSDSVTEDSLNKPWRPIPARHVTPAQMRRLLLAALPVVQAINFFLGGWQETSLLFGLTWMYNDLRGGDDSFLLRNMIISLAYGLYSGGSLRVACSAGHTLHETGFRWVFIITAIIFSTMHIQDLKDVAGDQARSRQSAPVLFYSYTALADAAFFLELQTDDQTYRGAVENTTLHICAYTLTLFTSITIYRVYFHRLHSIPGPFPARVSKLWHVYHARHSLNHQLILRLHKEYGPFVRIGKRNTHRRIHVD